MIRLNLQNLIFLKKCTQRLNQTPLIRMNLGYPGVVISSGLPPMGRVMRPVLLDQWWAITCENNK